MDAPSPLVASLHVALGGAIGSVLRYQVGRAMTHWLGPQAVTAFPWATLTVNIAGSLAMGLLAGYLARYGEGGEQARLLLGVGLLGGFTTFSAFGLETVYLLRKGELLVAGSNIALSVAAGLLALWLGMGAGRA
jgi:CrcB protein